MLVSRSFSLCHCKLVNSLDLIWATVEHGGSVGLVVVVWDGSMASPCLY